MEEDKGIYDDSEENTSTKHEKNNYDILSIQSSLNLKSYEVYIIIIILCNKYKYI